jgi:hypothetical protein
MHGATPQVTDLLISQIAEQADADRRTVMRHLLGLPVRSRVSQRIARCIAAHRAGALSHG